MADDDETPEMIPFTLVDPAMLEALVDPSIRAAHMLLRDPASAILYRLHDDIVSKLSGLMNDLKTLGHAMHHWGDHPSEDEPLTEGYYTPIVQDRSLVSVICDLLYQTMGRMQVEIHMVEALLPAFMRGGGNDPIQVQSDLMSCLLSLVVARFESAARDSEFLATYAMEAGDFFARRETEPDVEDWFLGAENELGEFNEALDRFSGAWASIAPQARDLSNHVIAELFPNGIQNPGLGIPPVETSVMAGHVDLPDMEEDHDG